MLERSSGILVHDAFLVVHSILLLVHVWFLAVQKVKVQVRRSYPVVPRFWKRCIDNAGRGFVE